jgi:hypothetical protein
MDDMVSCFAYIIFRFSPVLAMARRLGRAPAVSPVLFHRPDAQPSPTVGMPGRTVSPYTSGTGAKYYRKEYVVLPRHYSRWMRAMNSAIVDENRLRRSGIFIETTRQTKSSSPVRAPCPVDVAPNGAEDFIVSETTKMPPRWGCVASNRSALQGADEMAQFGLGVIGIGDGGLNLRQEQFAVTLPQSMHSNRN